MEKCGSLGDRYCTTRTFFSSRSSFHENVGSNCIALDKKLTNWTHRLVESDNTNVGFISHESRQPQPSPRQKKNREARWSRLQMSPAPNRQNCPLVRPRTSNSNYSMRPMRSSCWRTALGKSEAWKREATPETRTATHFHSHLKTCCTVAVICGFSRDLQRKKSLLPGKRCPLLLCKLNLIN